MRYSKLRYLGLPFAGIGLFAAGTAALFLLLPPGTSWIKAVLVCLLAMAASAVVLSSYRHADEVILSQQKTSWFWGSQIGAILSLPAVIGYCWNLLPLPMPADPRAAFAIGFAFLWITQGLAFMAMNLIRHLRDRAE